MPKDFRRVIVERDDPPTPDTHVRCPDCRELVRYDASKCKHCGAKLVPQELPAIGFLKDQWARDARNEAERSSRVTRVGGVVMLIVGAVLTVGTDMPFVGVVAIGIGALLWWRAGTEQPRD
jgi:hypothetical protein